LTCGYYIKGTYQSKTKIELTFTNTLGLSKIKYIHDDKSNSEFRLDVSWDSSSKKIIMKDDISSDYRIYRTPVLSEFYFSDGTKFYAVNTKALMIGILPDTGEYFFGTNTGAQIEGGVCSHVFREDGTFYAIPSVNPVADDREICFWIMIRRDVLQKVRCLKDPENKFFLHTYVSGSLSINAQIDETPISQMVFYNPKAGSSTRVQCGKDLTELPVASESSLYGIHAHKSGQFVMANM
jgi:hypothetical protein